jgi:L-ascorbate peroxidase
MMLTVAMTRSAFLGTMWLWSTASTSTLISTSQSADRSSSSIHMPPTPLNDSQLKRSASESAVQVDWNTADATAQTAQTIQAQTAQYARGLLQDRLREDPTLAGPLLRLAFHYATTFEPSSSTSKSNNSRKKNAGARLAGTGGPNGSIRYELEWAENRGLSRPFAVADSIFQQVQQHQVQQQQQQGEPQSSTSTMRLGLLSVADIIALAGAVAIRQAGGPFIPIQLGRIDAVVADAKTLQHPVSMSMIERNANNNDSRVATASSSRSTVTATMPSAAFDSDGLRLYFQRLGLEETEWVALSGTHGLGRHVSLLGMPKACLKNLTRQCLEDAPVLLPFVAQTGDTGLGNSYFKALLQWYNRTNKEENAFTTAFLPTDVALVVDSGLRKHVEYFAADKNLPIYYKTLARAYQKLTESTATTVDRY